MLPNFCRCTAATVLVFLLSANVQAELVYRKDFSVDDGWSSVIKCDPMTDRIDASVSFYQYKTSQNKTPSFWRPALTIFRAQELRLFERINVLHGRQQVKNSGNIKIIIRVDKDAPMTVSARINGRSSFDIYSLRILNRITFQNASRVAVRFDVLGGQEDLVFNLSHRVLALNNIYQADCKKMF